MKRLKNAFLIIIIFVPLLVSGCGKISDIKITSCGLESITPIGLRGVKAELALAVENPAMQFTLSDIRGILYYKGKEFVNYAADPITVRRHLAAVYPLKVEAHLAGSVSFSEVLKLLSGYNPEDFSTDIYARVKLKSGLYKNLEFKNIPIKELM